MTLILMFSLAVNRSNLSRFFAWLPQVLMDKHALYISLLSGLFFGSLSLKTVYAQSDIEVLYQSKDGRDYIRQKLTFIQTLDLTSIYDEGVPHASSLSVTLNRLARSKNNAQSPKARPQTDSILEQFERELSRELKRWPNLRLTAPLTSRRNVKRAQGYRRLSQLANAFAHSALIAYQDVDLDRAQASLDSAIELMTQAREVVISPQKVAGLYLFRGVISVEKKQYLRASNDFQQALLLDSKLRLKAGFDHFQGGKKRDVWWLYKSL